MNKPSRRHANSDFSLFTNLVLADVLMSGILGMIFLGIAPQDDKGLSINLAPYNYEAEDTLKIASSAILHLEIDSTSQLLIDSIPQAFSSAEINIYNFILKKFLTKSSCYIWIRVDRQSRYHCYIQLRDAIKRAEKTFLDDLSIRFYGEVYSNNLPLFCREKLRSELSISICIIEEDERGRPYFEPKQFSDYLEEG
jgi:biopolymer transport protein ExbD